LKRYEEWKENVYFPGPKGLREIKKYHDEALSGKAAMGASRRSSALLKIVTNRNTLAVLDW
jgi:hypothetical protein